MLSELYIENIAVIEKAGIRFGKGLNVLTGETGAGKSIVIDSIHAVLGERTSRELVRTGAKSAFVSAVFEELPQPVFDTLEELGYETEDGSLLLQRTISAEGKNVCRVNGRPATVAVLRELGRLLLSIHGQHDAYELLSPDLHLTYVDELAGEGELLSRYRAVYREMEHARREWEKLQMDETNKARRIDLLQYQIEELENAGLRAGEQEELTAQKTLYGNSEKVSDSLSEARACLEGGEESGGAVSEVESAADALLLSRIARKVILVHRRDTLRATQVYHEPLMKAENVEFRWNSVVTQLLHGDRITGVRLRNVKTGEETDIATDGVFVSVGRVPSTDLVAGQVELDRSGYIVAGESTETGIPGVYAVGDVRTKLVRQVVTAVSDGAVAVHMAEEFLAQGD